MLAGCSLRLGNRRPGSRRPANRPLANRPLANRRLALFALSMVTLSIVTGGLLAAAAVAAGSLAMPTDKPILTISGKISVTNKDGTAQFDRAMLEALGMVSFTTKTPWYPDAVTFEGVPLAKLLDAVGANGERLIAVALNDYAAELPIKDIRDTGVILALKRDGAYMPVRDKGPLFIVYPFDDHPELKSQTYYSRSVWQVARLEVK
jgi:hypothetical protein